MKEERTLWRPTYPGRWPDPLPDDRLKEMLFHLKLARYFDERMEALYRQGRLPGAIYSGRGQEGTHVGVAFPLRGRRTRCSSPTATSRPSSRRASTSSASWRSSGAASTATCAAATATATSAIGTGNRTFAVISHLPIAYPVAVGAALAYQRAGDAPRRPRDLRRRRHVERPLARGHQHVGRVPAPGRLGREQQPVRLLHAEPRGVPHADHRRARRGLRHPGRPRGRRRRPGGLRGGARAAIERAREGGGPTLIESVSLALARPRRPRPREVRAARDARALHGREGPGAQLRGMDARRGRRSPRRTSRRSRRASSGSSKPAYDYAQASPFPEPGDVTKGLWVEDGYWAAEAGRGGGTEAQLMATSQVEAGAAGHGAEPRGKRADDGQATYLIAIAEALWEEMERDERVYMLGEDIGVYGGAFKVTEGFIERFGAAARDGHADRGGDDRRHGGGLGDGGPAAGRRVPVRGLHVVGVRRDHDRAGALPLPHRRPAAGGAARAQRGRRPRLELPLHQPRAVVRVPAGAQGGLPGVPLRREGPAEVGDPRRQPRRSTSSTSGSTAAIKEQVPDGARLPGPARLGRREARGHRRHRSSRTGRWCTRRSRPPRTWPRRGISAEVVDLRSIVPLDEETSCAASRRPRARWCVYESYRFLGVGAEVAAIIAEKAFEHLDAPVERLAPPSTPGAVLAPARGRVPAAGEPTSRPPSSGCRPGDRLEGGLNRDLDPDATARRDHHRGHHPEVAQAGGRDGRARRAALRDLHGQGRHRGAVARSRASCRRSSSPRGRRLRSGPSWRSSTTAPWERGAGTGRSRRPTLRLRSRGAASSGSGRRAAASSARGCRRPRLQPDRGPRSQILSPLVRKLAAEHGLDLASVAGYGNRGTDHEEGRGGGDRRRDASTRPPCCAGRCTVPSPAGGRGGRAKRSCR